MVVMIMVIYNIYDYIYFIDDILRLYYNFNLMLYLLYQRLYMGFIVAAGYLILFLTAKSAIPFTVPYIILTLSLSGCTSQVYCEFFQQGLTVRLCSYHGLRYRL